MSIEAIESFGGKDYKFVSSETVYEMTADGPREMDDGGDSLLKSLGHDPAARDAYRQAYKDNSDSFDADKYWAEYAESNIEPLGAKPAAGRKAAPAAKARAGARSSGRKTSAAARKPSASKARPAAESTVNEEIEAEHPELSDEIKAFIARLVQEEVAKAMKPLQAENRKLRQQVDDLERQLADARKEPVKDPYGTKPAISPEEKAEEDRLARESNSPFAMNDRLKVEGSDGLFRVHSKPFKDGTDGEWRLALVDENNAFKGNYKISELRDWNIKPAPAAPADTAPVAPATPLSPASPAAAAVPPPAGRGFRIKETPPTGRFAKFRGPNRVIVDEVTGEERSLDDRRGSAGMAAAAAILAGCALLVGIIDIATEPDNSHIEKNLAAQNRTLNEKADILLRGKRIILKKLNNEHKLILAAAKNDKDRDKQFKKDIIAAINNHDTKNAAREAEEKNEEDQENSRPGAAVAPTVPSVGTHTDYYNPAPGHRRTGVELSNDLHLRGSPGGEYIVNDGGSVILPRVLWDEQGKIIRDQRIYLRSRQYDISWGYIDGHRRKTVVTSRPDSQP